MKILEIKQIKVYISTMIKGIISISLLVLMLLPGPLAFSQCPMCKASAEASIKEGGSYAKGLNAGILYLFATPYILVGSVGLLWWYRNRQIKKKSDPYS